MEKRKLEENEDEARKGTGSSPSETKRTRVIGPALPPGFGSTSDNEESKSKDESDGNESSDSDDDDDYGPTLPPTGAEAAQQQQDIALAASKSHEEEEGSKPLRRDDWMLKPPDSSDWSSRVDPTKIRNRKFNMGRSAPASKGPADTWTETAEEKKKRLAAELMGMRAPANQNNAGAAGEEISELDLQKKRQVEEYNAQNRKSTLYAKHKDARKKQDKDDDDDPAARPFDREKDIRGPTKVSNAQIREFINRSSDFGTKFSGGKFL